MNFGYELNKWSFEELSELIERLTEGGVPASYIIERVFISLVDCSEEVWEKLETLCHQICLNVIIEFGVFLKEHVELLKD